MTTVSGRRPLRMADVTAHAAEITAIAERHGVSNVRVFGSVARHEAGQGSDLDLLVDASPGTGLLGLSEFAVEVEDLLDVPTQVATERGLKPRIRARVLAEAIAV